MSSKSGNGKLSQGFFRSKHPIKVWQLLPTESCDQLLATAFMVLGEALTEQIVY